MRESDQPGLSEMWWHVYMKKRLMVFVDLWYILVLIWVGLSNIQQWGCMHDMGELTLLEDSLLESSRRIRCFGHPLLKLMHRLIFLSLRALQIDVIAKKFSWFSDPSELNLYLFKLSAFLASTYSLCSVNKWNTKNRLSNICW